MRSALLYFALAACASAPPPGLSVESIPLEPPPRKVAWRTDVEEALSQAFGKRDGALVFFEVPGDAACRRMARETLEQPRVRGLWTRMAAVRVNVDLPVNRDIVGTYASISRVPSFALFGPDGTVAARWDGFERADAFRRRVLASLREGTVGPKWKEEWAHAMVRLRIDDVVPLRELVAKLEREGARGWAARLALAEVRDRFYRYRWSGVVDAAELFLLRFPDHPAKLEVRDLRGRALFRGTGEREPELLDRISQHIESFGDSAPLLGGAEARGRWETARNLAERRLVAIGEPAAEALLQAVVERQGSIAEPCSRALGRIRYSRMMPDVIDALATPSLRFAVRARLVGVMSAWANPAFLGPLVEIVGNSNEAAIVRVAAASALARLGSSHGGLYGPLVINPVVRALQSRNVDLRRETIAVLETASDAFELEDLYGVMRDHRNSGIEGQSISNLACALFLRRAGARLVDAGGEPLEGYPREALAVIRPWWNANQSRMRWEESRRRYVLKSQ